RRAAAEHAHESPPVMTVPLVALAFCSVFFGVVLTPAWPWLHGYLTGESVSVRGCIARQAPRMGIGRRRSTRLNMRSRRCFAFWRTECGSTNSTDARSSHSHGRARACPTGWIAVSGMGCRADWARWVGFSRFLRRVWMNAALTREWMKRRWVRAVSVAFCPWRKRGGFAFIWVCWRLALWRCCFCTHGWLDHNNHSGAAARGARGVRLAEKKLPSHRFGVHRRLGDVRAGIVAKIRRSRQRPAICGTSRMDSRAQRGISGRRRWLEFAAGLAHRADRSVCVSCFARAGGSPRLLCDHAGDAVRAVRDVHGAKFPSLVFVLRNEPCAGVFADQNLGRPESRSRGHEIFSLHVSWQRGHVDFVSGNLLRQGHVRFRGAGEPWKERPAARQSGMAGLCRDFSGAGGESAAVSVSHLA